MQVSADWFDEAQREQEAGNLDTAASLYRKVLQEEPSNGVALYHLGTLELQRSNIRLGTEMLEATVALMPDTSQVHNNLGIAYKMAGRFSDASAAFEKALQLDPKQSATYFNLADLASALGQHDAAVSLYRQSLGLAPREAGTWLKLGEILYSHGNWDGAAQCLREVLDLGMFIAQPGKELELQCQLALILLKIEKLEEAAELFRGMLLVDPHLAEIHSNLAYVLERQGHIEEAEAAARKAVEVKPGLADGHNNLGVALRSQHKLAEARESFRRAAQLAPQMSLAHFNHGAVCLHQGDYKAGWEGYELRNRTLAVAPRSFTEPAWTGEAMPGKTLLLHTEQGYGDAIQFGRFITIAKERSQARVVVEGPTALLPMLATIAGVDECVAAGKPLPVFHALLALPSLGGVLGIEFGDLPAATVPYVSVAAGLRDQWRSRLVELAGGAAASANKLKIGLVWQGNPAQAQDHVRSCPVELFGKIALRRDVVWYSVQKAAEGLKASQCAMPGPHVIALGDELRDFADTAAVLSELDLLITVDTSVAHLAGALGLPVWTLLCHTPDWRWGIGGSECRWYPTMRLFRQPKWGDWPSVIAEVELALRSGVAKAA